MRSPFTIRIGALWLKLAKRTIRASRMDKFVCTQDWKNTGLAELQLYFHITCRLNNDQARNAVHRDMHAVPGILEIQGICGGDPTKYIIIAELTPGNPGHSLACCTRTSPILPRTGIPSHSWCAGGPLQAHAGTVQRGRETWWADTATSIRKAKSWPTAKRYWVSWY